jgi:hypothetical protein
MKSAGGDAAYRTIKDGQPGNRVIQTSPTSLERDQAKVMAFNWFSIRVPTTGTFRKVREADNDND